MSDDYTKDAGDTGCCSGPVFGIMVLLWIIIIAVAKVIFW